MGGGSESRETAHKCNWSLGIFTWGLINMPLKHSRHICPTEQRQRQIMMIRTFFFSSGFLPAVDGQGIGMSWMSDFDVN